MNDFKNNWTEEKNLGASKQMKYLCKLINKSSDGSLQPSRKEGLNTIFLFGLFQIIVEKKCQTKFKDFRVLREALVHTQKFPKHSGLASINSSVWHQTSPKLLYKNHNIKMMYKCLNFKKCGVYIYIHKNINAVVWLYMPSVI